MSDETERENLAKAEQWLARIVDGFRPPMETSMDKAATIQTEYDRRGTERDAFRGSAEHWAAEFRAVKSSVAPLSEALGRAEAERDEALGLLRGLVKYWNRLESTRGSWSEASENLGPVARDLKRRIRALVERASQGGET